MRLRNSAGDFLAPRFGEGQALPPKLTNGFPYCMLPGRVWTSFVRHSVRLENRLGKANPIAATMLATSPGIFTIDGSGNGLGAVLFPGTSAVATARNPVVFGEPAQPGDNLAVRVTGVPADALVYVQMGDVRVPGMPYKGSPVDRESTRF